MKFLSFNTQKAYQPGSLDFLRRLLQEEAYDFILLQETVPVIAEAVKNYSPAYTFLNAYDADAGTISGASILYKTKYQLKESFLLSFAKADPETPVLPWGCAGGLFSDGSTAILVATAHLHPGLNRKTKLAETGMIKRKLLEYSSGMAILGGDFNTGLPGEIREHESVFSPEFVRANKGLGPTLDSRYTERVGWGVAKIANVLASLGISLKFRADHFYMSKYLSEECVYGCKILPDRFSDHLAIELTCNKKEPA